MTLPLLHADPLPHVHELLLHPVTGAVVAAAAIGAAILIIRKRKA